MTVDRLSNTLKPTPTKLLAMELSKDYVKGFHSGYHLRKRKPMQMKELENGIKPTSAYDQGLLDENKEYERKLDRKLDKVQEKSLGKSKGNDPGLGL